jgi:hypothetical protein
VLSEFDCLLNNRQGEPFHLSNHLCADSLFLVFFDDTKDLDHDFPWPLFEETIDEIETKFEMIYIGDNLHKVPWKVKGKIVGYRDWDVRATGVLTKLISMLDVTDQERQNATSNFYFQMRAKRAGDEKGSDYRPCWKLLSTVREVEEFMLGKCRRYHRLKQLEKKSGESNMELLRELFATVKGQTTHIFQKNYASQEVLSSDFRYNYFLKQNLQFRRHIIDCFLFVYVIIVGFK